jgi:hypothetical protein
MTQYVTTSEIDSVCRLTYDLKRVERWFHNHTRSLDDGVEGLGKALDLKPKTRLLLPWQAYSALTYESQWKSAIDQAWNKYKTEWEELHPNTKSPKSRFTIMSEFLKEKLAAETPEMQQQVEEYRHSIKKENETPAPIDKDEATNKKIWKYVFVMYQRNTYTYNDIKRNQGCASHIVEDRRFYHTADGVECDDHNWGTSSWKQPNDELPVS